MDKVRTFIEWLRFLRRNKQISKALKEDIIRDLKSYNLSIKEIAEKHGVTYMIVYRIKSNLYDCPIIYVDEIPEVEVKHSAKVYAYKLNPKK